MYVIDTDVISALRRPEKNPDAAAWIGAAESSELYLSAATIAEIERGIGRQKRSDPLHAGQLTLWLDAVISQYGERILPIDAAVARRWGALSAEIGHGNLDLVIAATALTHGFIVVTRNVSDFLPAGVAVYDPFSRRRYNPR